MSCTCSNPTCPKARQFNNCDHCMCQVDPDFSRLLVAYDGPLTRSCCKCSYSTRER